MSQTERLVYSLFENRIHEVEKAVTEIKRDIKSIQDNLSANRIEISDLKSHRKIAKQSIFTLANETERIKGMVERIEVNQPKDLMALLLHIRKNPEKFVTYIDNH
jgi:septation ring formation regulator EzrA